jgi:DNA-binding NarL/FixJ family response regulator
MQSSSKRSRGDTLGAREPRAKAGLYPMPSPRNVRLAIVHENRDFREGLRSLLASEMDLSVVAELSSVDEAVKALGTLLCDIVLVYARLDQHALAAIGPLSNRMAIIIIADVQDDEVAMAAVRAGARSVVLNHLAVDGLVGAIRAVMQGHVSMPPALQAQLVAELRQMSSTPLTSRERDVTRLVAAGLRNVEIALRLAISEQTVKKHLSNIFQKLELRDRVELARYAMRSTLAGAIEGWGASVAEVRGPFARATSGLPGTAGTNGRSA